MSQVAHVGSNANNGTNAGVFTLNANNSASYRNRNIGRQLAVRAKCPQVSCSMRGEYVDPIRLGSESEQPGDQQR